MTRIPIDIAGFDAKFQDNPDPWDYATSPFEAHKRRVLRLACGSRTYGRGLELACANGETTKVLAPLCQKLLAVDGSPTAIKEAQRRTQHLPNVQTALALLPDDIPHRQFDLIVASEIFYYLAPAALDRLLGRLWGALAPGGRIVCLHHVIDFSDAATRPRQAQGAADRTFGRLGTRIVAQNYGRFAVSAFQKGR